MDPCIPTDIVITTNSEEHLAQQMMRHRASSMSQEKELRAAAAKLYQNYDVVTDEYDRLYEIVDSLREDYNNTKHYLLHQKYKEFRRIIKNSLRKWRSVEKRSTLAMSRKTSNNNYSKAVSGIRSMNGGYPRVSSVSSMTDDNAQSFSQNLPARLKAQCTPATRGLYEECTRLEREIFQYKSKNQLMKDILCKLAGSYESSKSHVLHVWGRFKELRNMIKEVIDSDV